MPIIYQASEKVRLCEQHILSSRNNSPLAVNLGVSISFLFFLKAFFSATEIRQDVFADTRLKNVFFFFF